MIDSNLNLSFAQAQEHDALVDAISDLRATTPTLAEPEASDLSPGLDDLDPACAGLRASLHAMLDSMEPTSDPETVSAICQGKVLLRRLQRSRPL